MEANNVFLLTTGMRCDDGPDPVYLERLSIEDDAVDLLRHSDWHFRSRRRPTKERLLKAGVRAVPR